MVWLPILAMPLAMAATVTATAAPPAQASSLRRFERQRVEMAIPMRIVLYAADDAAADEASRAAFDRIAALNRVFSDYDPESELRRLCETAGSGKAVSVSDDLWSVLRTAHDVTLKSHGAFDVTVGPLVHLWRISKRTRELPADDRLAAARALVGDVNIGFDAEHRAVELLRPGMRLDLGGIAKGFALAAARSALRAKGVTRTMVEAGGDICLGDPPPEASGWRVGIAPPRRDGPPRVVLSLANTSIATSGDRSQAVVIGGQRYAHIVDPRTGLGVTQPVLVSVVHDDGALCDALATAVSVMGVEEGLELIDRVPGAAAFVVSGAEGEANVRRSQQWSSLPTAEQSGR